MSDPHHRDLPAPTPPSEDSDRPERGRHAVEERLIEAAADLLVEVGPKQLSIRDVSRRARANSGQVYHYFGSKDALLQAAMARLLKEHTELLDKGTSIGLLDNEGYWRALGHAVLDGAEDLFRLEIDADKSIPLNYLTGERAVAGGSLDLERSAQALANIALTLGWATFEPFLLALVSRFPEHPSRDALRKSIIGMLEERFGGPPRAWIAQNPGESDS